MSDGDIDYSTFTLQELEEALAGIRRESYPKNYANLRAEYEQRTGATAVPSPSAPSAGASDANNGPVPDSRGKFWGARPVLALAAASSLWWAYTLVSDTESCPSGGRLIGDVVKATCDNFGHVAAAGVPFTFAVVLAALIVRPRR